MEGAKGGIACQAAGQHSEESCVAPSNLNDNDTNAMCDGTTEDDTGTQNAEGNVAGKGDAQQPSLSELMSRVKEAASGVNKAAANLSTRAMDAVRDQESFKKKKTVTIYARDADGKELSFYMRRNMRMDCFFKAYANKRQVTMRSFTFFYKGTKIENSDTPNSLNLRDDDRINVEMGEFGNINDVITITVRHENGKKQMLKVKMSTKLERLFEAYASLGEHEAAKLTFFQDGQRIPPNKTAYELGLRDNDIIDARVDIIEIFVGDAEGDDVKVKMKRSRDLQSAFEAYADAKRLDLDKYKFMYKGRRVDGSYTPASLQMADMDRIDCVALGHPVFSSCMECWDNWVSWLSPERPASPTTTSGSEL